MTQIISQAELRNGSAGVMNALEEGEDFVITRHGIPVGVLHPVHRRRDLTAEQLVSAFAGLPPGSTSAQMRAEADAVFGDDRAW